MKTSLVITTYNWKEALELVLLSIKKQSILPNEVIIADDGSRDDTKELIEKFQKNFPTALIHSWQEDKGFRGAKSRNKAIFKAKYEYIILIDGDMILHKDFIKDHISASLKGTFIQGSRVLLKEEKTKEIFKNKNLSFGFFSKDIINRKNTIRCSFLSKLFRKINTSHKGIRTCNLSLYKSDCLDINGFNEDFIGWGREDSEFVARLYNSEIKRQNLKFNALAYHIYHPENSREMLGQNDKILANTIDKKLKWCENGIDKYVKKENCE